MASLFLFFGGGFRNMSPATAVPFRFPQPARANQSGLCLEHHPSPSHNLPRHGDPFHRCLSGILARRSVLLTGLRHGDPAHRYLSGIPAWRSGLLTGFRHGILAYRYFRAILVWRRGHLSALRHGNPARRCLRGILAWRTASRPVHDRQLTDALTGLRHGDLAHRWF